VLDRNKGIAELETLTKSGETAVVSSAKFALAQAYEADAKLDQAANLYRELLTVNDRAYPVETINLRLACRLRKTRQAQEAVDLLFVTIEKARKAQGADGKPCDPTARRSRCRHRVAETRPRALRATSSRTLHRYSIHLKIGLRETKKQKTIA
jgi:hypothetical protein